MLLKNKIGMNFFTKLILTNIIFIGVLDYILEINWRLKLLIKVIFELVGYQQYFVGPFDSGHIMSKQNKIVLSWH
jgi:hypothetical protein